MRKLYLIYLSVIICSINIEAQLSLNYDFADCLGSETQMGLDAEIVGAPDCVCGVESSALVFDGDIVHVNLDSASVAVFNNDFTLSFYLWLDETNDSNPKDIFSIRPDTCARDSSLSIRYFEELNTLVVEFSTDLSNIRELTAPLDLNRCWQHIVIGKSEDQIYLYLNGEIVATDQLTNRFVFGNEAKPSFANSPCLEFNEDRFSGRLDHVQVFGRALSEVEIQGIDLFPDQIIIQDTTIFQNTTIQLNSGGTCSTAFTWEAFDPINNETETPEETLDEVTSTAPFATPENTIEYIWSINHGSCTTKDTILVRVVDEDNIDCENLLVPNVFTPNNDGVNDQFGISNKFLIEELESFEIFDKWGGRVFSGIDKESVWDGNVDSNRTNSNTFRYRIEYTCQGAVFTKFDSFILIR